MKESDNADSIIMLMHGECEVFATFEGNEFIIERLKQGSILNYRSFFMEDIMYVNVRCTVNCSVLSLNQKVLHEIRDNHAKFAKIFGVYENKLLNKNSKFPIDYIIK